jgi:hypothetical protein
VWLGTASPERTEEPQAPRLRCVREGVVRQDRAQGDRDHEDEWEPVRHLTHLTGWLRSTVCAAMNAAKPEGGRKNVLAVISGLGKDWPDTALAIASTTSAGAWSASSSRTSITRRDLPPKGIVRERQVHPIGSTSGRSTSAVAAGAGTAICSVLASTSAPDRWSPPSRCWVRCSR